MYNVIIALTAQSDTSMVKKDKKNTVVSEKIGVKDFPFGAISPATGGKLSKSCRIWEQEYNFQKSFPMCYVLCIFDDVIYFRGVRGTKNRIVCVVFQSECYVKISSTGNEV